MLGGLVHIIGLALTSIILAPPRFLYILRLFFSILHKAIAEMIRDINTVNTFLYDPVVSPLLRAIIAIIKDMPSTEEENWNFIWWVYTLESERVRNGATGDRTLW